MKKLEGIKRLNPADGGTPSAVNFFPIGIGIGIGIGIVSHLSIAKIAIGCFSM